MTETPTAADLRMVVIEHQLASILENLKAIVEKQEQIMAPLNDQNLRLSRVEGRIEDCLGQLNTTTKSTDSAHRRMDRVDQKSAYIAGAIAGVLLCSGFIAWSLRDMLEATRTLPVIQERQKLQMEQLAQSSEELKKLLEKHLDKLKGD